MWKIYNLNKFQVKQFYNKLINEDNLEICQNYCLGDYNFMDNNNNIITYMELPLKKQLAIIKLAKRHYAKAEKEITNIGMCHYISKVLLMNDLDNFYDSIVKYIPIFDKYIIYEEANKLNHKIKKPNLTDSYWYPVEEYKNRINVFNFMIKYLQLKIKENGK